MVSKYYGIISTPPPPMHACMHVLTWMWKGPTRGWMDEWILAASSDESGISKNARSHAHYTYIYFQEFMWAFPIDFFFKLPNIPCKPMGDVQKLKIKN